jgi:beta-N-acetylhexosaminidase
MTPEMLTHGQLAGQRLMVGFDGTEFNEDLKWLIGELNVGGVILFSRNIENPNQIRRLCRTIQEFAVHSGQPPLFIAVDQEGGVVARLRAPFTQFPGNPAMRELSDAERFARITASELVDVGINMNMAPVLDVVHPGVDSVMASRAFGSDPKWVSQMGGLVIRHLQSNGVMAVAKHFPGIGGTTLDSHIDRPYLKISYKTMQDIDLPPFEAAVYHDVAGIMLSHIMYPEMDDAWPASLSPAIVGGLLREKMRYNGVVLTDDLDMGAIQKYIDIETVADQVLAADIDQALICHKGPNIERAYVRLLNRISADTRIKDHARRSAGRVLSLKKRWCVCDPVWV